MYNRKGNVTVERLRDILYDEHKKVVMGSMINQTTKRKPHNFLCLLLNIFDCKMFRNFVIRKQNSI